MCATRSLLVFILLLSMHACSARYLGVHYQASNSKSVWRIKVKSTLVSVRRETKEDYGFDNQKGFYHARMTQGPKELKDYYRRAKTSGLDQVKRIASVSWRVPAPIAKHRHDKPPGLYSDYPKPSTRPPRHN